MAENSLGNLWGAVAFAAIAGLAGVYPRVAEISAMREQRTLYEAGVAESAAATERTNAACESFRNAAQSNDAQALERALTVIANASPEVRAALPASCSPARALLDARASIRQAQEMAASQPTRWGDVLERLESAKAAPSSVQAFVDTDALAARIYQRCRDTLVREIDAAAASARWPDAITVSERLSHCDEQLPPAERMPADVTARVQTILQRATFCSNLTSTNAQNKESQRSFLVNLRAQAEALPSSIVSANDRSRIAHAIAAAERASAADQRLAQRRDQRVALHDRCTARCDYVPEHMFDRCYDYCDQRAPLLDDEGDSPPVTLEPLAACQPGAGLPATAPSPPAPVAQPSTPATRSRPRAERPAPRRGVSASAFE